QLGCMSFSIGCPWPAATSSDGCLTQSGSVTIPPGAEQDVYFPIPYASPPNLALGDWPEGCVLIEQKADHFRIRNMHRGGLGAAEVDWTAKGVRGPAPVVPVVFSPPEPSRPVERPGPLPLTPEPATPNP